MRYVITGNVSHRPFIGGFFELLDGRKFKCDRLRAGEHSPQTVSTSDRKGSRNRSSQSTRRETGQKTDPHNQKSVCENMYLTKLNNCINANMVS